jgi:hypothetical protein
LSACGGDQPGSPFLTDSLGKETRALLRSFLSALSSLHFLLRICSFNIIHGTLNLVHNSKRKQKKTKENKRKQKKTKEIESHFLKSSHVHPNPATPTLTVANRKIKASHQACPQHMNATSPTHP